MIPLADGKELPPKSPRCRRFTGKLSQVLRKGVTAVPFKLLECTEKESIQMLLVKLS